MRQKDLLAKLNGERDAIRKQLQQNERVMQSRMDHLAKEKDIIENKVQNAAIKIQKTVKMRS